MRPLCDIGLTGGIGSGKSTVAAFLAARGCHVVDADAAARSLTLPGGLAIPAIAQMFGTQFIDPQGALDRDRMRQHVFADPAAKRLLESILHPRVSQVCEQQAHAARQRGCRHLVFDVPLLVETGRWRQRLHQVWVVDCQSATQIERVMARNALPRETVEAILAAQASRTQRLQAADVVLYNDGISLPALEAQVDAALTGFGL